MPNSVYSLVNEALARVVSERAADHMLRAALRDAKLTPEEVNAQDMQRVLAGPLESRLVSVMPPSRARQELRTLAGRLHALYPKAPTLFPQVEPVKPVLADTPREHPASTPAAFSPAPAVVALSVPAPEPEDDFEFDADDFVFDDPAVPGRVTLPERFYALATPAGQDSLLADLARFEGVQGVVLCDANGKVLRSRVARGADALGAVMAATAALLKERPWRILCADLGAQTVCVKPLGSHSVALLTGSNTNLGRLIAELSVLKESA